MIANSATQTATLRSRLRDDTRKQHEAAEARPVECAMAAGRLTVEQYTEVLAQRYLVHVQLESLLDQLADKRPEVQPLTGDTHKLAPIARADLVRLGVDPDEVVALPATERTIAWLHSLAAAQPIALVGPHYVFEGSKNGARFIRRGLIKAWGADYATRLSYLDPHGEEQPLLWKQFAQQLDQLGLSQADDDAIVQAAADMFDAIAAMDDELAARFGLAK